MVEEECPAVFFSEPHHTFLIQVLLLLAWATVLAVNPADHKTK